MITSGFIHQKNVDRVKIKSKIVSCEKWNFSLHTCSSSYSFFFFLLQINKYAFSGGGATVDEHREKGGDCDVDIAYQYLTFFLEDDEELEKIRQVGNSGVSPGGRLNKKDGLTRYGDSHVKDKTS